MGYFLFSYGIKTKKIRAIFGSKDQAILEKIKNSDIFDTYSDCYKALKDIIAGEKLDKEFNFAYGYAVICLCDVLGQKLPYPEEIKLGHETDLINKYLKESFKIDDLDIIDPLLADNTNPFDIPKIEDFPIIGLLSREDLVILKEIFEDINITDNEIEELESSENGDDEEKSLALTHIRGIIQNIDYCIKNKLDLITFCH
ncbi:MAG: hypothetical protein JNL70_15885 [Saprospiraceae bacterium]|nr:hypothetical protein [Saprospiraceae bacterium]